MGIINIYILFFQIIILLIQQWLQAQRRPRLARSPSTYMRRTNSILDIGLAQNDPNRHSYQVINSQCFYYTNILSPHSELILILILKYQ